MSRNLLLINPWAYDFAAYDLWARPLGFLYIAAVARELGFRVFYLDCMDRAHPVVPRGQDNPFGCGTYHAEVIEKPRAVSWVKKRFKRYGMPMETFRRELAKAPEPAVILITSRMTYWYPALMEAVALCRERFSRVPIVVGGTYVTLCPEHARRVCGADYAIEGECEFALGSVLSGIVKGIGVEHGRDAGDLDALPYPAFDLLHSRVALPVLTSRGCPKRCTYCAARILSPAFRQRKPESVVAEIRHHSEAYGAPDFTFYDDALLADSARFERLLDGILDAGLRVNFHCPNGMDFSTVTATVAEKMFRCGFVTLRLSLETASCARLEQLNRSQSPEEFVRAMRILKEVGFRREQIGVYVMIGLPYQSEGEVREAIDLIVESGGTPHLAEFSPLPGTSEWQRAVENATMDIEGEPLLHNSTVYHLISRSLEPGALERLKRYIKNEKDGKAC